MPEKLISHKIRLALSPSAKSFGKELVDDFYVMLDIGEDEIPLCTLRELLMEQSELSDVADNDLKLPTEIARFRGIAKHADAAAMHVRKLGASWGDEERKDPREYAIWAAQLHAGRQALAKHGITVSEEALAEAYDAMNKAGEKAISEIG